MKSLSGKTLALITLVCWVVGPILFFKNSSTQFGGGSSTLLVLGLMLVLVGLVTLMMAIAALFNKKPSDNDTNIPTPPRING